MSDLSYSRWSRPQFGDPNPRRKRSPRSDQAYAPDDYVLSNDFQEFNLDSPPGQDYNRYGDMYGLPNPVGHFSSNPNLGAYVRNNYPHQQSYLSDLQTYHGASPYTPYRQNYGSDNIRIGSEVMLSEAPCSYFKSCSKDRGGRARSKQSESLEDLKLLPDGITSRAENSKKHKSEAKNRMCIGEDFKSLLGKRKAEQTEDHEVQFKKQKFYFEREEHYVVHKLLRELSIVNIPSDLPRTTSASLFYHLLSSKTEPRVMQTVGGSTTSSRQRKIIVRDDVSEEQVGFLCSLLLFLFTARYSFCFWKIHDLLKLYILVLVCCFCILLYFGIVNLLLLTTCTEMVTFVCSLLLLLFTIQCSFCLWKIYWPVQFVHVLFSYAASSCGPF